MKDQEEALATFFLVMAIFMLTVFAIVAVVNQ